MIPLFTSSQVRESDRFAINKLGIPGIVLMENAALSIYREVKKFFPELNKNHRLGFVAGKGNNGGDAFAAARHFINAGFQVTVVSLGSESKIKGDALTNYKILKNLISNNSASKLIQFKSIQSLSGLKRCQIIFDGLLGTGAQGELKEPYGRIVKYINDINCYKVAIDIPTGLNADNGSGDLVFDADLTITLAELKRGLFFGKGYKHSGEIFKGRIGIGDEYFDSCGVKDYLVEPEDAFDGLPERELDAHKYSAGKTFIIAGSWEYPGAAALTANSALGSGSGSVVLSVPKSILQLMHTKIDSAVINPYNDNGSGRIKIDNIDELRARLEWADTVAVGPGLGRNEETLRTVRGIVNSFPKKKFVIDADALYAFDKKGIKGLDCGNIIFTPHHKEFANMLNLPIEKLQSDLLSYGKEFALRTKSYLALKGAPTIIFTPKGEALVNTSGNPGLAKFGSGDVLTGIIASFAAQNNEIESSLLSAVYLHGLIADLLAEEETELGITAEKLIQNIPEAIRFLYDSFI